MVYAKKTLQEEAMSKLDSSTLKALEKTVDRDLRGAANCMRRMGGNPADISICVEKEAFGHITPATLIEFKRKYEAEGYSVYNNHAGDKRFLWVCASPAPEKYELQWVFP